MHSFALYIFCALCLYQRVTNAAFNFATYPLCAQTQLQANAPENCDYGDSTDAQTYESNECLCADVSFLTGSARGIYTDCGCDDLLTSAGLIITYCGNSDTPSILDQAQIISAGDGGQSECQNAYSATSISTFSPLSVSTSNQVSAPTSIQAFVPTPSQASTPTPSQASTPTSSQTSATTSASTANNKGNGGGGGNLSVKDQIIIGVVIPTVAILIALGAWCCPCKRH